jgi:magnesium chelatase family protein
MTTAGLAPNTEALMVLGDLELSGNVRPVRGVLAAIAAGLGEGIQDFIVPQANAREAMILAKEHRTLHIAPVATLQEALHALLVRAETGSLPVSGFPTPRDTVARSSMGDFSEVRGQRRYKRALEIAAAGGHNLLVFGPPGAGKTMLARRIPSIMAPLTSDEAVEVTRLYSLAGQFDGEAQGAEDFSLITTPPFRSPHHSASAQGIIGGGRTVRPGEISLAHLGVLFLDEAPQFRSPILQALREPLEDQVITISRAESAVRLPASFQLVMAANPCPCGRLGIRETILEDDTPGVALGCFCSPEEVNRYWRRFGSALLDRIELRVPVIPPTLGEMKGIPEETSATIARRVLRAVEIQRKRLAALPAGPVRLRRNAHIPAALVEHCCPLSVAGEQALKTAIAKLALSGRAYHGILRLARTIADLEARDPIDAPHIMEAVEHRRRGDDPYDILAGG